MRRRVRDPTRPLACAAPQSELAESMETIVELDAQLRTMREEKEHFRNLAISNVCCRVLCDLGSEL